MINKEGTEMPTEIINELASPKNQAEFEAWMEKRKKEELK